MDSTSTTGGSAAPKTKPLPPIPPVGEQEKGIGAGDEQGSSSAEADELWQSVLEAMAGIVTDMRQRDKRYLRITLSAKDSGEPVSIHIALGGRSEELKEFTKEWPNV